MENKRVRLVDELLELDGHRVHRNAKCGLKLAPADACIDIGSVWYMFKEITGDKPYSPESARKRGFKYIGVAHRGDLCDYLVGRTDSCAGLVLEIVEGRKRLSDDLDNGIRSKRTKLTSRPAASKQAPADHAASGNQEAAGSGQPPHGQTSGSAGKELKAGDITYADVAARVRPVHDLDVLVRVPGRTVPNAELILKIAQDEVNNWHVPPKGRIERPPGAQADGGKVPLIRELEKMLSADKRNKPIILVPCNKKAPVNILNATLFLQDGRYNKADAEHVRFFESTRMEYVDVVRNIGGKMWTFEVRDSAKNFTKAQWLRVVAVITDGTDWQFKGWPFESVVDLFTTVKGIFFREVGTLTPLHVSTWAVSILDMAPVQFQHRFSELRDAFWVEVERFLASFRHKKYVNHTTLEAVKLSGDKPKPVL